MKSRGLIFSGAVLVAVILIAGPFMIGFSSAAQPSKPLKIGIVAWLGWGLGLDLVKGAQLITEGINKKGGLTIGGDKYPVELLVEDSKFSNDVARAAVEKLVYEKKVQFILGDETVDAWLPITEKNKVLVIAGTPSPAIFNANYKYAFQGTAITSQMQVLFGLFTKFNPNVKTIVYAAPDNKVGNIQVEKAKKITKLFGLNLLDAILWPTTATDLSALATRINSLNPDVVSFDAGGPVKDGLNYKAVREAGFKGQFFSPHSASVFTLSKSAPVEIWEGYFSGMYAVEIDPPPPVAKEYKDAYIAQKGTWDFPDTLFINTLYLLLAAVEEAKSVDTDKVAEVISKGLKFDTPNGSCMTVGRPDLGNPRAVDTIIALAVKRVEGGKAKRIYQPTLDETFQFNKTFYGWK